MHKKRGKNYKNIFWNPYCSIFWMRKTSVGKTYLQVHFEFPWTFFCWISLFVRYKSRNFKNSHVVLSTLFWSIYPKNHFWQKKIFILFFAHNNYCRIQLDLKLNENQAKEVFTTKKIKKETIEIFHQRNLRSLQKLLSKQEFLFEAQLFKDLFQKLA